MSAVTTKPYAEISRKTERLELRPLVLADYAAWRASILGRRKKANPFDDPPIKPGHHTKAHFLKRLRRYRKIAKRDHIYVFAVFDRRTGGYLGAVDLWIISRGFFQWANVGYQIHNQYWGRGYAKEAVRGVLSIAFRELKLHRIEASTELRNLPSIAVARAAGLKKECTRRKFYRDRSGSWSDSVVFSMTRESWRA